MTKSIEETLIFLFWPFYIFETGQLYSKLVIPASLLDRSIYWNGRSIYFVFSPFFILILVLFFVYFSKVLFEKSARKKLNFSLARLLFLAAFLFSLISIKSSIFFHFSFFIFLKNFSIFIYWLLFRIYLAEKKQKKKEYVLFSFFLLLLLLLSFETFVVFSQLVNKGVLGLVIEKSSAIPSFGNGVDEFRALRPIGLHFHANSLSNWFLTLFFAFPLFFSLIEKKWGRKMTKKIYLIIYLFLISVILLTLSRSAYLVIFISFLILLVFEKDFLFSVISYLSHVFEKFKLPLFIFAIFIFKSVPQRIYKSIYSLTESGGMQTRILQFQDALNLIKRNIPFGVGVGMFIPAMMHFFPEGEILKFPENVHNGLLLYISERGLVSFIFNLLAIFVLMRSILVSEEKRIYKIFLILGIISNFVMMFFQPFDNMLSLNIIVADLILRKGKANEKE